MGVPWLQLVDPDVVEPGRAYAGACTGKSTIFTANVAAGLMLEQSSRWLRRLPVDADVQFNLLSTELGVAGCRGS